MSPVSRISNRSPKGAVERAEAFGLDLTLLIENLRRTPTERLRYGERALHSVASFQDEARRARLPLYGLDMKVLSLEGLLVAKRAAARKKDKEAIVELEALLELRGKPPSS